MANEHPASNSISTASLIIDISIWILSTFVLLGIECYYLYRIVKTSDSLIIRKRKPGILLLSVSSLLLYIVISSTMAILNGQHLIHSQSYLVTQLVFAISVCATLPFWYIYVYFNCTRYWLLFFDIHFAVSCSKKAWHGIIDASLSAQTDDFYLHRKRTFGSWTFIKPRLLSLVFLFSCYSITFLILLTIYTDTVPLTLAMVLLCIHFILTAILPFTVCMCIAWKIPAFDDNIGLREELKFCNLMFVCMLIVYAVYQLSFLLARQQLEHHTNTSNLFWTSCFVVLRICFLLTNLKQTRWPLKRFQAVIKRYSTRTVLDLAHQKTSACIEEEEKYLQSQHERVAVDDDDDEEDNEDDVSLVSPMDISGDSTVSLREEMRNTLQDARVFDKFMQRLLKEHCAECLLSIIEFLQFSTQCYAAGFHAAYDKHGDIGKGSVVNSHRNMEIDDEAQEMEQMCSTKSKSQRVPLGLGECAGAQLVLPDDAHFPRSCLVFKPKHMRYQMQSNPKLRFTVKDYKLIARELYRKYIAVNSEFEINIDGLTRRRYRKLFENDERWITNQAYNEYKRLSAVFDACVQQMTSLITASFVTWKNSAEFSRIQKQIVCA